MASRDEALYPPGSRHLGRVGGGADGSSFELHVLLKSTARGEPMVRIAFTLPGDRAAFLDVSPRTLADALPLLEEAAHALEKR